MLAVVRISPPDKTCLQQKLAARKLVILELGLLFNILALTSTTMPLPAEIPYLIKDLCSE